MNSYSHLTRQLTLIPVDELKKHTVHVIGCGAIGSFTALALAKMGIEQLTIWDFDEVGIENVSCQIYGKQHLGYAKTAALTSIVASLSETVPSSMNQKLTVQDVDKLSGIVILAVDSMKVRKEITHKINEIGVRVKLVIDPRMGAEKYLQYAFRPFTDGYSTYLEHYMYDDKDVVEPACTAKATIYTAMLAAGMIAKTVKNFIMKQEYPKNLAWDIASTSETSLVMFGDTV